MARIRTVKPEFWVDEKVVELSPWARLLFIGLWNFADDQGYIDYATKRIKMQVFPGDTTDVVPLLDELLGQGILRAYQSPIGPVLHVVNWRRHQRVDHPARARFDASQLVAVDLPESSRGTPEGLARPSDEDPHSDGSGSTEVADENHSQKPSRGLARDGEDCLPSTPPVCDPAESSHALNPREDSRTLAPEGKGKEGKGSLLRKGAAPPTAPDGAQKVVAAYIDSAVAAGKPRPSGSLPGRVGKDAKQLLSEGISADTLIAAATAMGAAGWHNLHVQLQRPTNGNRAANNGNGWDGPFMNPEDPKTAYAGYNLHGIEGDDELS